MKSKTSTTADSTALQDLFKAISLIKSSTEAERFLVDLCTPQELQDLADRWRVVDPIKAGKPYREIYDITGVSTTTIGRVARSLSYGTGGYDLIYNRHYKNHEKKSKTTTRDPKERSAK